MMKAKVNLFIAWFLMALIISGATLAQLGTRLLGALGTPDPLDDKLGWLVGALLLLLLIFVVRNALGELPPGTGKPGSRGYLFGHGLLLASSASALGMLVLPLLTSGIHHPGILAALSSFEVVLMYQALGLLGIGMTFIYQSGLTSAANTKP